MYDLVIRNGTIYDGKGGKPYLADLAILGKKIAKIGDIEESGSKEIDAQGKIITPGFVDIHTHYDGQVTWDPYLRPSTYHGVTTVVMGNCGVGFSPCKPEKRDWLIGLMEGVEDIPGTALHEGINWEWETFPEYLDYLSKREFSMDIGTQVPHSAVRNYVMGERALVHEDATSDDLDSMSNIVKEAISAGALGFSTSRTAGHRSVQGDPIPGTYAESEELLSIARAMIKKSPIILLDEATSSLDSATERLVQTAINKMQQGRTTIIIAHRLSTIQNADRIIVLKEGEIIEQGSHKELINASGEYAKLNQQQFQ